VIKQEYYQRNLKLAEFGRQAGYVKRYYCYDEQYLNLWEAILSNKFD
jgi:hypothetical protein